MRASHKLQFLGLYPAAGRLIYRKRSTRLQSDRASAGSSDWPEPSLYRIGRQQQAQAFVPPQVLRNLLKLSGIHRAPLPVEAVRAGLNPCSFI